MLIVWATCQRWIVYIIYNIRAAFFTCRISVYDAPCVAFMILCKCAFLLFYAFIKCAFVIVCLWNCRPCAACCYLSYQMQCFQDPVCCVSDFVPLACLQMLALLPTLCWLACLLPVVIDLLVLLLCSIPILFYSGLVWFGLPLCYPVCIYPLAACLYRCCLPMQVGCSLAWIIAKGKPRA